MPRAAHILALLLFIAASAAAQTPASAAAQTPASAAPVTRLTETADELVLTYGPVSLPSVASPNHMLEPPVLTVKLPDDGWLRGIEVDVLDANGGGLPRTLLHHITLIQPDQRDLFSQGMMRIGAAGAETGPITLPRILGLRVHRGDSLFAAIMLHNETTTPYPNVTVRAHLRFTRASSLVPALTVYPMSVAIGPKFKPNVFDLPPGRSEHIWEGSPAVSGRMLGVAGHLHRYGVLLRFEDRTTGKILWEQRPQKDSSGEVLAMPVTSFAWTLGKPLDSSHVYRLTATYDNPTGATIRDGGMGVLGGVFVLTGGRWPRVDPANAEYLHDLMDVRQTEPMHDMMP